MSGSAARPVVSSPQRVHELSVGDVRRVIFASSLGTVFEWYDFYLYGSLAAIISKQFFSGVNPTAGFIFALLAFAAGFIVRPFGAIFFGRLGDMIGRKYTFLVTILIMGVSTSLVGILPSYASIGMAAPVILIVLRLLQGLALGGEYGGAATYVAEHAPKGRRGFFTSWIQTTATVGLFLSLLVILGTRAVVGAKFDAWGWRIPFIVGLAVGLGGLLIRRHFVERVPHQPPAKSPLGESFRHHWRTILHLVALVAGLAVGFYTVFVYAATWLAQVAGVPARTAFEINTLAMAISLGVILYTGRLSDRIGRRRVLVVVSGLLMVLALPLMALMARGQPGGIVVGQVVLAMLVGAASGVLPATMAELAPWRVRCTVLSVAYNLGMALLGGTTPLVAAWLLSRTGVAVAPAWYLTAAGALAFVAAILLPKTFPHRLTTEFHSMRPAEAQTPVP